MLTLKRKYRKDGTRRLSLIKGNEADQCQDICLNDKVSKDFCGRQATYFSIQTIGTGDTNPTPLAAAL